MGTPILLSPYVTEGCQQFRGNLHTHTTQSDGPLPPQATLAEYARRGYDFVMISDHDMVTRTSDLDAYGMTLIPGNEITQNGQHLLHVNASAVLAPLARRQTVIDAMNKSNGFAIVNHPNWGENFIHCTQAEIESLRDFVGIEIYNGVSERVEGNALATDRWDMLLSKGRHVWGFGNDDNHIVEDIGTAWNMVFAENASMEALLDALRRGSFYVSTGVRLNRIAASGNRLHIQSDDVQCYRVIRDHGMVLATVYGQELNFETPDCCPMSYIRVECFGLGPRMAWTQPFFVR